MVLLHDSGGSPVRVVEQGNQRLQQGPHEESVGRDQRQLSSSETDDQDARARRKALLKEATQLSDRGELDAAWAICDGALKDDPDDLAALICATQVHYKSKDIT